jgi:hypothetical protein
MLPWAALAEQLEQQALIPAVFNDIKNEDLLWWFSGGLVPCPSRTENRAVSCRIETALE